MFRRRDFLYKRSHYGPLRLAARDTAKSDSLVTPSASSSPTPDPKTSDPAANPSTSQAPAPKTTDTPTTSASSPTPSLSTQAASSAKPSSSSSSPTSSSSSLSTPSTAATTAASTVSTPLSVASPTTAHASAVTSKVVTGVTLTATSALPTTTSSTGSSGGTSTTAIVGGVAGALAGIAILGFLLMWCMRRQRNQDVDDFDAQAFKRQSAILVDDPVEPTRSHNPRPPTMIERHNASPALAAQAGYGGQNFYGSYGGYSQQPPYAPPEMIQPAGSPPPQAYGAPPVGYTGYNGPHQGVARQPSNVGHPAYDPQQQLARQPSDAAYLARQPSSAAGYALPTAPPESLDPNAHYIDLSRSSISPYQAAQYADISRQLGNTDSNAQAQESVELPDGPLPSPFDDPVETTPVPQVSRAHPAHPSNVAAPGMVTATPAPQTQGNTTVPHQRPFTVYDEGDAYGGI